jgi:hypothetical protein
VPVIVGSDDESFPFGIPGEKERKGMIAMPMHDIKFRPPKLPQHRERDMIGVVGGEAPKSPHQDTAYFLLFRQFTRWIGGENGDLMLPSQPLADVAHVLLHAADGGEVSGAYLKDFH